MSTRIPIPNSIIGWLDTEGTTLNPAKAIINRRSEQPVLSLISVRLPHYSIAEQTTPSRRQVHRFASPQSGSMDSTP